MTKKLTMFLLAAALLFGSAVVFSSCSKDDDEGPGNSEMIVGTWIQTASEGYEKENGVVNREWNEGIKVLPITCVFKADGMGLISSGTGSISSGTGSIFWRTGTPICEMEWSYSGGELYMNKDGYVNKFKMIELTPTRMVHSYRVRLTNERFSYEFYDEETFVKSQQ